jgi:CHAT domain-containing protein
MSSLNIFTSRQRKIKMIMGSVANCAAIIFSALTILAAVAGPAPGDVKQRAPRRDSLSRVVQDARPLEPGSVIRRELAGGDEHDYLVRLAAGRYMRVALKQLGIDVIMSLIGQDGRERLRVDYATGLRGQERLSLPVDEAGEYRLKISPKERSAVSGEYEISIVEERAATLEDSKRLAAERAFAAAESLRKEGTAAAREQSIAKYDEARQLWREVNDAGGEAYALLGKGKAYFYASKLPDSVANYEVALPLFESLSAHFDVAVTHQVIGISKLSMADSRAALEQFLLALPVFITEGDRKLEGATLYQMGRVYYLEGDLNQALSYYNQSLPIRHALRDRQGEAYTLLGLGRVYANGFGDDNQALSLYNQALVLLKDGGENRLVAQTLGDVGRLYYTQGNYDSALSKYDEALRLVADSDKLVRAELLMYVGMVYSAQGRQQEAIDRFYTEALRLQQDGSDAIGAGHTLKNMGVAYSSLGNYEKALEHLTKARDIWLDVMYRTAEADTRYEIARVKSKLNSKGSLREADEQLGLALPILETLRTKISNQTLRTSFFASAQKYYELRIDVLMRLYEQTKDKKYEAQALGFSEQARARSLLDTLIEAGADIREGVTPALLQEEAALQQKLSLTAQGQMLKSAHTTAQSETAAQNLAALLNRYHELESQIREKSPRYASLVYPKPATLADIQAGILEKDQMLLEYSLGEERSYLWAVTPTSVDSYVLPRRSEIESAAEHVVTLLTARNQTLKDETDLRALARVERADAEYNSAAVALSQMLLGKVEALPKAARLIIVGDGELQYLPFAALPLPGKVEGEPAQTSAGAIALGSKSSPLLLSHEVETQPSVTLLAEFQRRESGAVKAAPQNLIAIIADPVFNEDDERFDEIEELTNGRVGPKVRQAAKLASPSNRIAANDKALATLNRAGLVDSRGNIPRLTLTQREAREILRQVPQGEVGMMAIDFDAQMELVTSGALAQYRIIHFATHGLLDKERPELSGILLSLLDKQRRPKKGFLQMHEVYNLHLPVEMVVLSACETGVGKMIRGEGLTALSRGFMYAGAKRVVASLWEVNDNATVELMSSFYRNLFTNRGQRPAAALRAAQFEMWRRHPERSPYYWAAFIIQGH